jgi:hypothetical protein
MKKYTYYAIHKDGEPVKWTACHSVCMYDSKEEAQEDNPDNEIHKGKFIPYGDDRVLVNSETLEIIY